MLNEKQEQALFIHPVIKELVDKDFDVIITKQGFYIPGFYGVNEDNERKGYALLAQEKGELFAFDLRGSKVAIERFEDLVFFNNRIWASFFRTRKDEFPRPSDEWLPYMIQYNAISLMPGK